MVFVPFLAYSVFVVLLIDFYVWLKEKENAGTKHGRQFVRLRNEINIVYWWFYCKIDSYMPSFPMVENNIYRNKKRINLELIWLLKWQV